MKSLRRQLSRDLLVVTLVLLVGGVVALYFAARDAVIEEFDFSLSAKALALSTLTVATPDGVQLQFNGHFFHGFDDQKPRDFFELWAPDGQPLARSVSLPREANLPRVLGTPDRPRYWNLTLPTGRPGRAIGFRFTPRGQVPGAAKRSFSIVVASDRDALDENLWGLVSIVGGLGALLIIATLVAVPRALRHGLRSVDALAEQAAGIDAGSLGRRFPVGELPAELQPIAIRLNALLGRLEDSFERERQFSADLAHELRTPIAELRSMAECALKWPQSRDAATDRETLAIAEQMEQLVGYILALARAEDGELTPVLQPVRLDEFVCDVWRPFAAAAAERDLEVECSVAAVSAVADPTLLRAILGNLFDNAVDYAPRGTTIRVRASVADGKVTIAVANDAPELERADALKLFDRFWRKEAARTGGKHVGLGLSLARAFAAAMGWSLSAAVQDGQITFQLVGGAGAPRAVPAPV